MVQPPTPEPTTLFQHFYQLADAVLSAWDEEKLKQNDTNPRLVTLAIQDLEEIITGLNQQYQDQPPETEISRYTDYGLSLFKEMAYLARQIKMDAEATAIENLTFPFALWGVRLGAQIATLEPIVNAIARLANQQQQAGFLEKLYREVSEVMQATVIDLQQEQSTPKLRTPWRTLLLNRAIIATRSHRIDLMDDAFISLVSFLPDDAPTFFREGMEQMHKINYPVDVRDAMMAWYHRYANKPTLH